MFCSRPRDIGKAVEFHFRIAIVGLKLKSDSEISLSVTEKNLNQGLNRP